MTGHLFGSHAKEGWFPQSQAVTTGSRLGASLVALLPNRNGLSPLDLGSRVLEGFKWGTDVICFIFQKDHVAVEWVAD